MKEQILLDTTFIPEYDEYVAHCEINEIEPQAEDSNDYWNFVSEMQSLWVDDLQTNIKFSKSLPSYWVISGSLGLWYGVRDIEQVLCYGLWDALQKCFGSCDDVIVKKRGSVIYVSGMHHDGTNHFQIQGLTNLGAERLERNGKISLTNRENIVTLPKYLF